MSGVGRPRHDPPWWGIAHGGITKGTESRTKEHHVLYLILGIVLLVIAIAGGTIVHPILFALAIVALVVFFMGRGAGRRRAV